MISELKRRAAAATRRQAGLASYAASSFSDPFNPAQLSHDSQPSALPFLASTFLTSLLAPHYVKQLAKLLLS